MTQIIKKYIKKYHQILNSKNLQNWKNDSGDQKLKFEYSIIESSIIFELGAYNGGMVRQISEKFNPFIYAFEPSPTFYKPLNEEYESDKIKIFNFGLSDKNECKTLINSKDGSYISKSNKKNLPTENVKLIKLSEFIIQNKIEFIDLININIEGSEYKVLKDLISSGVINKINHLQIQFHRIPKFYRIKKFLLIKKLNKTHNNIWKYNYVWERWDLDR
jgi:FkbM family methyltransferase